MLAAAAAPVALIVGAIAPGYWVIAGAWLAFLLGLILIDALLGPSRAAVSLGVEAPAVLGVARRGSATLRAAFDGAAPREGQLAIETNARLGVQPAQATAVFVDGAVAVSAELTPLRRGEGEVSALWLRWRGALGLVWKQVRETPRRAIAITPDLQGVKAEAIQLFSRDALFGLKTQLATGDGSEFHALREVGGGADPRTIDWKQSARHGKLLGQGIPRRTQSSRGVRHRYWAGHERSAGERAAH